MSRTRIAVGEATNELRKDGQVVGLTDQVYAMNGSELRFKEIQVQGDLSGVLEYNGRRIKVKRIGTITGLKVDAYGARGPIWEDVECEII